MHGKISKSADYIILAIGEVSFVFELFVVAESSVL
jgi:hypothetical protein